MNMDTIKLHADTANAVNYIRAAFVSLGVDASNIKNIHYSPGGFAARNNRWCIVLYRAVRLPATKINAQPGFSGAIVNGNAIYILLGDEMERAG